MGVVRSSGSCPVLSCPVLSCRVVSYRVGLEFGVGVWSLQLELELELGFTPAFGEHGGRTLVSPLSRISDVGLLNVGLLDIGVLGLGFGGRRGTDGVGTELVESLVLAKPSPAPSIRQSKAKRDACLAVRFVGILAKGEATRSDVSYASLTFSYSPPPLSLSEKNKC